MKTNPNGANQYQLDPRQKMCWDLYINPKSATFANAKQSAIKAGYDPDYADQITTIDWFLGRIRRLNMLNKAEKVLDETLEMPIETIIVGDEKEVVVTSPALLKIKQDTAKFIAERLGKADGYSVRVENTGPDGGAIEVETSEKKILDKYKDVDDAILQQFADAEDDEAEEPSDTPRQS